MAVSTRRPRSVPSPPHPPGRAADGARFAPPRRQRSLPLIAIGVLCAFGGALVFAAAHLGLDDRPAVLAVAREVAAGSVIQDADLRVVQVSSEGGLRPVPAAQRREVVGKVAAVSLAPGSLLTRSQVGSAAALPAGQAVVGVGLKGPQLPAVLRPGDRVMVVDAGAGPGNSGSSGTAGSVLVPTATVFAVPPPSDANGATVVSLVVSAYEAPVIATAAAAERVSLVLLPAAAS